MNNHSIPLKAFNDKIRVMNQSRSRELTLTAEEARNLHVEIFTLLEQIAVLSRNSTAPESDVQISMDGGGFK